MFYGADMMQNWNYWSSRAHGLNIHAPYYDRQVLDFIWGQELLSQNKDELRSYAATMMPEEMARRGKLAQSVPIGEWLKGPLKQWVLDELSSHQSVDGGLFDRNAIQSMIEELRSNGPLPYSTAWTIWGVVMILIWMRTFTPIRGRRKHSESRQSVLIEAG